MPHSTSGSVVPDARSDRQRYLAFRSREIEYYKEVVEYPALLRLVDVARERVHARGELVLGDITLAAEVDELVAQRLRLPSFRAWSRTLARVAGTPRPWSGRGQQLALQLSDPHGAAPVLLLQPRTLDVWEALCSDGRQVVLVEPDDSERQRVLDRAAELALHDMLDVLPAHDATQDPARYASVLLSASACADMLDWETAALLESLKAMTVDGGVHVVDGLLAERAAAPRHVLRSAYGDWTRHVQRGPRGWTLIARQTTVTLPMLRT